MERKIGNRLVTAIALLLLVVGLISLFFVGYLIWNDIMIWGKDFDVIFFGSRTGENISLGIGLQVIHYYILAILLLTSAIVLILLKNWNKKKA